MSRKVESIYKRKGGRWEAWYIKEYSLEGKAKYAYCYVAFYHEVKEKVSLIKAALLSNQPTFTGNFRKRFAVYCDEWLILNRLKVKESNAFYTKEVETRDVAIETPTPVTSSQSLEFIFKCYQTPISWQHSPKQWQK